MTNKRYYRTNVNLEDNNHEPYYNIRDRKKGGNNVLFMVGGKHTSKEIVDKLNEQEERIKKLEEENKLKGDFRNFVNEDIVQIKKENEQLKEALKELKEIGDYQAMVIQESYDMKSSIEDEIDKKIAVLTDAKIKSFHNGDEELLKKIKFSIQVLRELKEVIKNGDAGD